jgi:hypothetical protein
MSSKSFVVSQEYVSVWVPDNGSNNELIRTNNMKLEAFVIGIACAFASIVVLLVVLTLLLVATGYAGSRLALH